MRKALARIFAILAIGACAVAIYSVVHANFLDDDKSKATKTSASTVKKHKQSTHKVYVVKAGDTLSAIAHDNKVTVVHIKNLNPALDDHGLQPGQKLHLR